MGSKIYNFDKIKESLRSNLQQARKKGGFRTQNDFAEALSVSVETVRNWEQGRTVPELGTLFRICDILNCDMDYLIGRLEAPTHDLAFMQSQTRLSEDAIKKLIRIAFSDRATGRSMMLSRFIECDDFEYLLALLCADAGETQKAFTVGGAYLQVKDQAVVRYERDSVFHEMANSLEVFIPPLTNEKIMYGFVYGMYAEGELTYEQLQDVIEHYDQGDFDYIPPGYRHKKPRSNENPQDKGDRGL